MLVTGINRNDVNFKHVQIIDLGASNPKVTRKRLIKTLSGITIIKDNSPNSYLNTTVKGFLGVRDFLSKVSKTIKQSYEQTLLKDKSGECPLSDKEKMLAGVVIFVPGTTYHMGKDKDKIAFMPNVRDREGESLKNIDFTEFAHILKTKPEETGIKIDEDEFKFVVTKDLGGTGMGLAKIMAQRKMLENGDYVVGVMTGGGFGSVDLKVADDIVHFETSESSSNIAGNYEVYGNIANIFDRILASDDQAKLVKELKSNNYEKLKEEVLIPGKLGRQGVNVKSHIGIFCTEIGRPDLFPLLRAVGDARIVEMNRMCVSEKDTELIEQIKSMPDIFREIESTTDGKIAFEIIEEAFGESTLNRARTVAVNAYANTLSLFSINKINDNANKLVLLGPFAHGVNQYVKTHSADFDGAKDLPDLIMRKIETNIDSEHVDLPSTTGLKNLYEFQIICDTDINFPDNTYAGELFLNPNCKFTPRRGGWFSIPLATLEKA